MKRYIPFNALLVAMSLSVLMLSLEHAVRF